MQDAVRLHRAGDLAGAATAYQTILERDPSNADALHLLGLVELGQGSLPAALALIQSAIDRNPDNPVFHFNFANTQRRAGNLKKAIESYRRAIELDPNDADTLNNLAQTLLSANDLNGALEYMEKAHVASPSDAQIACNLGELLFRLDRLDEAAHYFRAAAEVDPKLAEAHNNLGAVAQSLGDNARAADHYRSALALAPDFAHAHKNLAGVLHLLGKRDEAILHYRKALQIDPELEDAAYELAALEGNTRAAPPQHYVAGVFDQYAHDYDAHMTGVLGYAVPTKLRSLAAPYLPSRPLNVLDLGCGTGLSGALFHDIAGMLTGIDLAPKMIEKARKRGIYDHLRVGDIVEETKNLNSHFDLVVAADVFVYLGDLDPVFGTVREVLKEDGLFAFSVEHADSGSFVLRDAGRYAHSPGYVVSLALRHGLRQVASQTTDLRKDFEKEILGDLYLFSPSNLLK